MSADAGKLITGRDGTADITMPDPILGGTNAISFACNIRSFTITSQVEQIDSTVLCTEANPTDTPGNERLTLDMVGLLRYSAPSTGPLIPAPQNAAVVVKYRTGCTITGTFNFDSATATKIAGGNSTMSGHARSQGAFVVAWDRGT